MKNIIGFWEMSEKTMRLGELILFAEELALQRKIHQTNSSSVCFLGDKSQYNDKNISNFLLEFSNINEIFFFKNYEEAKDLISNKKNFAYFIKAREYGKTTHIKSLLKKTQVFEALYVKKKHILNAMDFLKEKLNHKMLITLHLKNNPIHKKSNANFVDWFHFIKQHSKSDKYTFVIIGNEKVHDDILNLPNVIATSNLGYKLINDLALIQLSFLFMGMVSGPCNFALFNKLPYILYKDPDHSIEKMRDELGDHDKFPFALKNQKVFRSIPSPQAIKDEFDKVIKENSYKQWMSRIDNLRYIE